MDPSIPVVDLGKVSELLVDSNQDVRRLADEIHRAFCTVGFVYVKNHGIPQKTVSKCKLVNSTIIVQTVIEFSADLFQFWKRLNKALSRGHQCRCVEFFVVTLVKSRSFRVSCDAFQRVLATGGIDKKCGDNLLPIPRK